MPEIFNISQLGNPILRHRSREVTDIKNPVIQSLIDGMIKTCRNAKGVGIAAPQVHRPLRIFIVAHSSLDPFAKPLVVINPKIISTSEEQEIGWEGCLSIPGMKGLVARPNIITASFFTRGGIESQKTFTDFPARIFQHEFDHLEGIVFLDRMNLNNLATLDEYKRITKAAP